MLIHFEDQDFEFDIEALTLADARYIKRNCGLTVRGLMDGLAEVDPEAALALFWLMHKQNGQVKDINKLPDFPLLKFAEAIAAAFAAEQGDEEENPTEADPAAPKT